MRVRAFGGGGGEIDECTKRQLTNISVNGEVFGYHSDGGTMEVFVCRVMMLLGS